MKKKIMAKLRNQDGAAMAETIAGFFIACLLIALLINVFTVLIFRSRVGTFAENVGKIVAVEGTYNAEVQQKVEEYKADSSLGSSVQVSLAGTDYISGTDKIQLNGKIKVTVTAVYDIGFFTFGNIPIEIKNNAVTRSEVYWK